MSAKFNVNVQTGGAPGSGATINVTCSEDFAGLTITCSNGSTTLTQTCPAASPYEVSFAIPNSGTWTISGTIDGDTYTTSVVVNLLYSTTLKSGFDWESWVTAGGLDPTDFSDLADVFASEISVYQLMLKHASADYLISAVADDIDVIDDFVANDTAMKWIGLCDYVCDGLTAINGVEAKFMASTYWERYLKDHVPTMTSNTAPYGEAFTSGSALRAFDGNASSEAQLETQSTIGEIGYKFTNPICVRRFRWMQNLAVAEETTLQVSYSDDGTNYTNAGNTYTYYVSDNGETKEYDIGDYGFHLYWKVTRTRNTGYAICNTLQFYGRQLSVSVPVMTSNTAPYGISSASSVNSSYEAWKAFDRTYSTLWCAISNANEYLRYKFPSGVCIKKIFIQTDYDNSASAQYKYGRLKDFKLQGSNDGSTFVDLLSDTYTNTSQDVGQWFNVTNNTNYEYYNLSCIDTYPNNSKVAIRHFDMYGVDYSEKEFEAGTTRKWLYDHGLELEEMTAITVGTNAVATKNDDNLYFEVANSSSFAGFVTALMDLTNYSLLRAKVGDICASSAASGTLAIFDTATPTYNTGEIAYNSIVPSEANLPNNKSLDISSLDTNYSISVCASNDNGLSRKQSITELWVE